MKKVVISMFFIFNLLNGNVAKNIDENLKIENDKMTLNISPYEKELNKMFNLEEKNKIMDFQFKLNNQNLILNDLKIFEFEYDENIVRFGYKGLIEQSNYYINYGINKEINNFDITSGININFIENKKEYTPELKVKYNINDYNKISTKMIYIDKNEIINQKVDINYELNLYTKYLINFGYKEDVIKNDFYINLKHLF